MPTRFSWFALASSASLLSCSSAGSNTDLGGSSGAGGAEAQGSSSGGDPAISSLRIEPINVEKTAAYGATLSVPFHAYATYAGSTGEKEVQATFDFSDPAVASFDGETLVVTGKRGGKGTVTVRAGAATVTTTFALNMASLSAEDGLSPDLAAKVLGVMGQPGLAPTWAYPEQGAVLPPNLRDVAFRWTAPPAADAALFEVVGKGGAVRVLTKKGEVILDEASVAALGDMVGAGVVKATVYAFSSADPTQVGVATRTFTRSKAPLAGAMYYWASKGDYAPTVPGEDQTSPRGYFRFDFSSATPAKTAELFLGFNRAGNQCVGCHAITRDGSVFSTSFEFDTHWATAQVSSKENPIGYTRGGPADAASLGNFTAFTPDGAFLLATDGARLRAFDMKAASAVQVASFTTTKPATHIAISPKDGKTVLYVEDLVGTNDTHVMRGRIMQITWDGVAKGFSAPKTLLEDQAGSVYYPAISPDGEWVLYNRATTGDSYSNAGAEIWAMRLDGSIKSVKLAAANKGPNLSNSWPRWAPFASDDGDGHLRYYFTFSSVRGYGALAGAPQLWLSTFDPSRAAADPSTPAVWLPMQLPALHNHAAQWTEVFVPIPK